MASQNSVGLTNGVNGTVDVKDTEQEVTMEVKVIHRGPISDQPENIQGIVPQSEFIPSDVQQGVHQPGFIAEPEQPILQPDIIHPEIQQTAVHQPGFVSVPQEITGGADFIADVSQQPVTVDAQQEITGGAEFIADASQQLPVVAAPQEITGGADFIAEGSQQPAVVAAPQEIIGGVGFVADASQQPAVVAAPIEITGGADFIADASQQPAVVAAPQEITGGVGFVADASQQPAIVTAPIEISGQAGFIADASQQRTVVTAPQEITGGAEFTREDKDVTTVPGVLPGTTFKVPEYAISAVNQIAAAEGFTDYIVEYERGSNHGDGFVAEIVLATIKGNQIIKGVQEESQLILVLKLPPENKSRREMMGMKVFEREVLAYNEILPLFQQFQLDKGLKPGQGFVSFPKCYFASYDKEKDEAIIIMEDIRKKGFRMQNKYKTVDFPHAKAVLETVAQFHGISMAMKDQRPEVFEKYKGLADVMSDGMLTDMMKSITAMNCQKAMETLEPQEEKIKEKLRAFEENIFDIIKTCTNGELSEPFSVLNHGDCWVNNMMFKYQSGFPRHLRLLDWQIMRYASPVLDICYFLYLCTDSELRAQHFDNLIQAYHISLRKQVELLGSDVNQILPFTALLRELKSKAKFALTTALFIIPMLCTPNAELPNMDEMVETLAKGSISEENELFQMSSNTEPLYKIRMGGILRDMHKKGYL